MGFLVGGLVGVGRNDCLVGVGWIVSGISVSGIDEEVSRWSGKGGRGCAVERRVFGYGGKDLLWVFACWVDGASISSREIW